ncbi:3-carboxy-cis,cis-muconate cycloisomerase [Cryptosporangium aurantiacum]|uniref:3-carboxy-cis,cis-muconate cycloisomerase n=1 Tax=Cryptosporangium aurantiacum TaxID=134849 RepID=UPI000B22D7FA|nr:3-carboxy-cis,cis-muconate cycloisomerase [Cryptosporangium aurantiacum]
MPSDLFGPLFADDAVAAQTDDGAVLRALLDVEAALARAEASVGVIPADAADAIVAATSGSFDVAALGRAAQSSGNPVVPLVRALEKELPESARPWVHHGATSQDVLDTALMLVAYRATGPILDALRAATDTLAALAQRHRGTLMVGRTLGQQALPTTFGLKAAGWLVALDTAAARLRTVRESTLAVQFGGAAGTLAALRDRGLPVAAALAAELGLAEPTVPWHTDRQRILDLGAGLAGIAAALGKVSLDLTLLAQSEVAEVAEGGGGGGSSAMPHKRNPAGSILVRSAGLRTPGLLATLHTAAAQQEHERATGGWHAEWEPLRELLDVVGGASARAARILADLRVDADRMRATLDATGGVLLSENVSGALAGELGRSAAHDLVKNAVASGRPLREVLLDAGVASDRVDAALDPANYLGSADALVDRALAAHAETWRGSAG